MDNPFLRSEPLLSPTLGASFDPDTLIVSYMQPPRQAPTSPSEVRWSQRASGFHERLHWRQHHGTTTGAFLSTIRSMQAQMTSELARVTSPSVRETLVEERRHGRPIIEIDRDTGELTSSALDSDPTLAWYRRTWYHLQQCYVLFDDHVPFVPTTAITSRTLPQAVERMAVTLGHKYKLPDLIGKVAEIGRAFDFDGPVQLVYDQQRALLTCRGLMEASCVIAEVYLARVIKLLRRDWKIEGPVALEEDEQTYQEALLAGTYGAAFRLFSSIVGVPRPDQVQSFAYLRTFLIVCDIALNPPLPPFFDLSPRSDKPMAFDQFHPPARFVHLCEAANNVGLFGLPLEQRFVAEYVARLCSVAKLPNPARLVHVTEWAGAHPDHLFVLPVAYGRAPKRARFDADVLQLLAVDDHRDYLLWMQRRYSEARRHSLREVIFGESGMVWEGAEHEHLDTSGRWPWWDPPLWAVGEDVHGHDSIFVSWLLGSVARSYYRWRFMVTASGSTDLDRFPAAAANWVEQQAYRVEQDFTIEW